MDTVLITGGTGFLGKRLALALRDTHRVVLAGRNNKQNQAAAAFTKCTATPMDVGSIESVRDAFVEFRPDIVIHAAATKFVDLAERFPMECVDVNVTGSQNVARVAVERGVRAVVGISTDKAAPPVRNTYGMSKAIMERVFCAMDAKTETRFLAVRYGNVAWSTGSVLPIWKKMHAETGVIGTTGPNMTRFFFTVDDAVRLIQRGLSRIDELRGTVLSMSMKSALIKDILDVWVERFGGKWQPIAGRPGERNLEYLIGDLELEHTRALDIEGVKHFVISFNQRFEDHETTGLNSDNAQRLSRSEIESLLSDPPIEER